MIKLPKNISKSAFILKRYERQGKYAIYEKILKSEYVVFRAKHDLLEGDVTIGWEVIIVSQKEAGEIMGRQYPKREVYPGNEQFGSHAWTFNDFSDANRKYRSLFKVKQAIFTDHVHSDSPKT